MTNESVVVAGGLAHNSSYGGHAWVFLQYLLGFRRLGYDVTFVDRVDAGMGLSEQAAFEADRSLLEPFGLGDRLAVLTSRGKESLGIEFGRLMDSVGRSILFLNFMGFVDDQRVLARARRPVFFDIDPGFGQMWRELGLADVLEGHDRFVTIGENIGTPGCSIPAAGVEWTTTHHPIVLDQWPAVDRSGPFTAVGAWRGPFASVEYLGNRYGLRVHEFRRFASIPRLRTVPFEAALDLDPTDAKDFELLEENGWKLLDPVAATGTPNAYRQFIQRSGAEFGTAKNMYVQARAGWFSDRSICYLASGKPVLVQDTGIGDLFPTGEGLLTFSNLEEALAGIDSITGDYRRHCAAARSIAEQIFDSDKVLRNLIDKVAA